MAGKKVIGNRVQGSTILEVLISMIFIMIIFGIATMIFVNVIRSSTSVQRLHAQGLLKKQLADGALNNRTDVVDSIRLEEQVTLASGDSSLMSVHLAAYDMNNVLLAELNKMIYREK